VLIEAEHTCMSVRGVAKHGAMTFTSRFTGMFRDNPAEQAAFPVPGARTEPVTSLEFARLPCPHLNRP
jgi:hypothetical protein